MSQNPTENLRRGRRRIEEIPEIILLKDWTWDEVYPMSRTILNFRG